MAPNHLGPYSQEGVWQISNAHDSGEASAIFEVDLNGLVTGNALAFTWSNEFRPLSWGLVNVVGAQGGAGWNFYTFDGVYQAYLPPGTYQFTIVKPRLRISILVRRHFIRNERSRTERVPRTIQHTSTRIQRNRSSSSISTSSITIRTTTQTQLGQRGTLPESESARRTPFFFFFLKTRNRTFCSFTKSKQHFHRAFTI